jgi:hypothetical protein
MWMAGGGVKGGQTIGSTDDLGLRAAEDPYRLRRHRAPRDQFQVAAIVPPHRIHAAQSMMLAP